jgi:plastocyanin
MSKRISLLAVAPVAAALLIAGCGGSSSGGSSNAAATTTPMPSSGGQVVKLSADPGGQLRFNTAKLTAKPGKVSTVTVTLKKGTYEYYCPVPGHKEAGMKGTLTVQ